jgi:hypothetical protein
MVIRGPPDLKADDVAQLEFLVCHLVRKLYAAAEDTITRCIASARVVLSG